MSFRHFWFPPFFCLLLHIFSMSAIIFLHLKQSLALRVAFGLIIAGTTAMPPFFSRSPRDQNHFSLTFSGIHMTPFGEVYTTPLRISSPQYGHFIFYFLPTNYWDNMYSIHFVVQHYCIKFLPQLQVLLRSCLELHIL